MARVIRRLTVLVFLLVPVLPRSGVALTTLDAGQPQYARSLWKVQDGLPEGTVQALAQTHDGYLWIGTTAGSMRFDGTHFVLNGSSTLPIPAVNSIFCLHPARDGCLWIGTEGGGLLHVKQNAIATYVAAQGLTVGFVGGIVEDSRGIVWVGRDNGLFRVQGSAVKRVEVGATGPLAVHDVAEDRQGRLWVGGSRLLRIERPANLCASPGANNH